MMTTTRIHATIDGGRVLRDARIAAGLSLREVVAVASQTSPDFSAVLLGQIERGVTAGGAVRLDRIEALAKVVPGFTVESYLECGMLIADER